MWFIRMKKIIACILLFIYANGELEELKIDIIYNKLNNRLLYILPWENNNDRVNFLKMPVEAVYIEGESV